MAKRTDPGPTDPTSTSLPAEPSPADVASLFRALEARVETLEREVGALRVIAPAASRALSVENLRSAIAADPCLELEVLADFRIPGTQDRLGTGRIVSSQHYAHLLDWARAGLLLAPPRVGSAEAVEEVRRQTERRLAADNERHRDAAKARVDAAQRDYAAALGK